MEYKTLELNISSAKDLNNVNLFYKMDVYAVVSISGDPLHKQKTKTPLDREGGTNPTWNFSVKFTFNELLAHQNRLTLKITLRCLRNLVDKNIGSVKIPLRELVHDHTGDRKLFQHVSYQVRKPSGKPKGSFNFSYKFNPPMKEHATGYPSPAVGSISAPYTVAYLSPQPHSPQPQYPTGYVYPPPPQYQQPQMGYGYPQQIEYSYPPQNAYGYPSQNSYSYPQQNGYGYPAPHAFSNEKSEKKSNVGIGVGALLVDF